MSRKTIKKKEKIFVNEDVTGFKKDKKTGLYRLITQKVTRETNSGDIKTETSVESEDLYELSTKENFDHSIEYQDIDGTYSRLYFRKLLN